MFQVGEASFFEYHPIVEAHVRVYGVLHEEAHTRSSTAEASERATSEASLSSISGAERAYFQTRVMRLTNPNDELGGMLFLPTPQVRSALGMAGQSRGGVARVGGLGDAVGFTAHLTPVRAPMHAPMPAPLPVAGRLASYRPLVPDVPAGGAHDQDGFTP